MNDGAGRRRFGGSWSTVLDWLCDHNQVEVRRIENGHAVEHVFTLRA